MVIDLTDQNYSEFISTTDDVVLIDFYTDGCPACQQLMPTLGILDQHFSDEAVTIARVNVSYNPKLGQKYQVRSVPLCVVIGKDKMVKEAEIGANISDHYIKMINSALGKKGWFSKLFGG
jgi:thiol-disulfide isomerase/thioredoxin